MLVHKTAEMAEAEAVDNRPDQCTMAEHNEIRGVMEMRVCKTADSMIWLRLRM